MLSSHLAFRKILQAICFLTIVLSFVSCTTVKNNLDKLHDTSPLRQANETYQYAGHKVIWQKVEDDESSRIIEFKEEYNEVIDEALPRRLPNILKGETPVIVVVTVVELSYPTAFERALFQNPEIEFTIEIKDSSTDKVLSVYDSKFTDIHTGDFEFDASPGSISGSVSFRLTSIPEVLANATVAKIIGWLRET